MFKKSKNSLYALLLRTALKNGSFQSNKYPRATLRNNHTPSVRKKVFVSKDIVIYMSSFPSPANQK